LLILVGLEGATNEPYLPEDANLEFFYETVSLMSRYWFACFFGDNSYPSYRGVLAPATSAETVYLLKMSPSVSGYVIFTLNVIFFII
jgi:hypothetical protein